MKRNSHIILILLLLAVLFYQQSANALNVAIIGSNSNANISAYLNNNGFTVTDYGNTIPSAATLAGFQAVLLLRTAGNGDLKAWVNNGGLLITEWSGADWAVANVITATVSTSGSIGTGTPITFSGSILGTKLSQGLPNPYSDGSATEFFYTFSSIGSGVETLATRPTNIPAIIGAAYGTGYTFVIAYDWADGFSATSSNNGTLIVNALNSGATGASLIPANPSSITATVNPVCSGNTVQLTANGAVGTVYWYTGSCGGTQVTTGNPITVSPSTTTTYYARNFQGGNYSSGCAQITINVEPTPVSGSLTKNPNVASLCQGYSVSAALTPGSGGNGVDQLEYRTHNGTTWSSWAAYTSGSSISTIGLTAIEIQTRRTASTCSSAAYNTVSWVVNPLLQYRTTQSGNWTVLSSWQQNNGSSWVDATSYPGQITNACASPMVTVQAGHQVEVASGSVIEIPNLEIKALLNSPGKVTVKNGAKLTVQGQLKLDQSNGAAIVVE